MRSLALKLDDSITAEHIVNIKEALIAGFKTKGLRFYGRSSRAEFWYFYVVTMIFIGFSYKLNAIPTVGSLLQAVAIIAIIACQYTATIRRLHDTDMAGKIVAAPYLLTLVYLISWGPLNVLQPEYGPKILDGLVTVITLSYLYILFLCTKPGTKGNNKYGTDPLDEEIESQDFVNPDHMQVPQYLGDPWAKFKARVARDKQKQQEREQAIANGDEVPEEPKYVSVPTPKASNKTSTTNAAEKHSSDKLSRRDRKKHK